MGAERQQGTPYQRLLFPELEEGLRHDQLGEGGTGPERLEESQTPTALDPARALTERAVQRYATLQHLKETAGYH